MATVSKSWPRDGYPLVPARYRTAWFSERIPAAVLERVGLQAGMRIGDLGADVWERGLRANQVHVLANHVVSLITARLYHQGDLEVATAPVLIEGHLTEERLNSLPFATRTRNVVDEAVRQRGIDWLNRASAVDFLSLRSAGPKTLLDYATLAEIRKDADPAHEQGAEFEVELAAATTEWDRLVAEFPVQEISATDPRIRNADVAGDSIRAAVEANLTAAIDGRSLTALRRTRRIVAELEEGLSRIRDQPLDEALEEFAGLIVGAKATALVARLGWDGQGGLTLQEAGELAHVTRERIRQLETKIREAAREVSYLPALDRAVRFLDESAIRLASEADVALETAGITNRRFLPHGVTTAAAFFGRDHRFVVGDDGRSVELSGDSSMDGLRSALRSITDVNHVAPVAEIVARTEDATGVDVEEELVRSFLDRSGVVWLDKTRTWFWDGTPRLRYGNNARKILAVEPKVSLETLRAGVLRHHRTRNMSLPREAFAGLCRALGLQVADGYVSTTEELDPAEVLGNNEATILAVLRDNDNVLGVWELRDECVERGVNRNSFWVYLTYSPILERVAPSIYAIRGADVDPARVSLLAKSSDSQGPALQDHGWTRDGSVWLGYRVTRNVLDSGVVSIPKGVRDVVGECRLELYTVDGTVVGEFVVSASGNAWGLTPFMARRGVDRDDYIVLALDTQLEMATAQAGTEDLLLTYQEGDGWGPRHFLDEATRPDDDLVALES